MSNNEKVLVVIDIQKEYNTEGRPFCIPNVQYLQKASDVLKKARTQNWPIVHVQHLQEKGIFAKGDANANFIDGFDPTSGETHVTKFLKFLQPRVHKFPKQSQRKRNCRHRLRLHHVLPLNHHRGLPSRLQLHLRIRRLSSQTHCHPQHEALHKAATDILSTFCKVTTASEL